MHFNSWFGALALAVPAFCIPSDPASPPSTEMIPLNVHYDPGSPSGIHGRAAVQLSSMDPRTQDEVVYGSHAGDGQMVIANMTFYAEDGLQIVMMERFQGLTQSIDCKGDDGTMSVTFNSDDAFQYALKTWDFINQSKEKNFILIANANGCGPDNQRQPYIVTNIREDAPARTTFLTAQIAQWSEVLPTYDIDIGHALAANNFTANNSTANNSSSLSRRGLSRRGSSRRGLLQTIGNALVGNFDFSKSKTFNLAVGSPNKPVNVLDTPLGKFDCTNCFVTGSLTLAGHISIKHLHAKEVTLTGTPTNLNAHLELGSTITGGLHPDSLSFSKNLFKIPVPDAGISVAGIFSLGAIISYDVGASAAFTTSASIKYGISANIPGGAKFVADLLHPEKSTAVGFDGVQLTPLFDVAAFSAGVTLTAFSQPKISFGLEIIKIAKFDAALAVKLPEVTATLTGGFNSAGQCGPGTALTGVNIASSIGVEVDFNLNADLLGLKHDFTKKLFGVSKPLIAKCIPVLIPGLGPPKPVAPAPAAIAPPIAPVAPAVAPVSPVAAVPIPAVVPLPQPVPVAAGPVPPLPSGI